MNKIQFSNTRVVKDAMTVWYEAGPEVDVVMDLKNLTFRPGSIDVIYSFHILDHFFPAEAQSALNNWKACLSPKGILFIVVDDFELLNRAFVSGDFSVDKFNESYCHPMYFTRDNLLSYCIKAGFKEEAAKIWYADVPNQFLKLPHDLIFEISNG